MNQQEHEEIAELLLEAYASREPVEPLTAKFPGLTVEDAYQIQLLQVRRWLDGGAQVKGHKVGLTSAAMQRQLGVDQPDYGHLLDRMFWLEYEPVPAGRFLQPRVEPEMAFVLARRGLAIEPGWIVLTGGMTDAVAVPPGTPVAVHFTHLGSIFLP